MKITAPAQIEVDLTRNDISHCIMQVVDSDLGPIDDAGCDWYTDGPEIYISGADWHVCTNENLAALVDAANILRYGEKLVITPEMIESVSKREQEKGY